MDSHSRNEASRNGREGNDMLARILNGDVSEMETGTSSQIEEAGDMSCADDESTVHIQKGFCVECEDQPASLFCEQCQDDYCSICFASQHRKGTRKAHTTKKINGAAFAKSGQKARSNATNGAAVPNSGGTAKDKSADAEEGDDDEGESDGEGDSEPKMPFDGSLRNPAVNAKAGTWFLERSKYIPMRLDVKERKYLRLLEAALQVSEYTDKIDIISYQNKNKRIVMQIKELCSVLSGLVLAADYKVGQELFETKSFADNEVFFQAIFEFGRRYKIMNPDRMRSTYGKLMYLLMDSQISEVKRMLEFNCVSEIKTVYRVLEEHSCLKLLEDDIIIFATQEIIPEGRTRSQVQQDIRKKERAIEALSKRYGSEQCPPDTIKQCLYSIGDNHSFLRANRDPCDAMIEWLTRYFHPVDYESGYSLAIQMGRKGARLTHDHSKQYAYVLQSLTLWREVLHDMFQLWYLSETDLLSESNVYRLRDTGQGLNRVQAAPRTSRAMHNILHRAQQKVGSWVGSSVIHMGDHNVPNAFYFIDKYTQVHSILNPIVLVLNQIERLVNQDQGVKHYVDSIYGGVDKARKDILVDFFRHGFDGSGADNFFDAGSCVDGR
ncbi:hypothetical protein BJ742DRAFT_791834 [Cladochytrium replicatum]|nr:hypothetical protein BJ742DRAFT_791834 [Cladochytrium replicatum]